MSYFQGNSIFWIEVEKIKTNPYQPRKEFDEEKLKSLAESVRQYGVLQPLVVTRVEFEKPDGGIATEYELIAGERRLRASRIANLSQVPVIIKSGEEDSLLKLELAIIENIQREDLNPIDRAIAFNRLVEEFGLKHGEVGKKVGKSREYVSNTLRLLTLPDEIKQAVAEQKISEGHARTLMMLNDRAEEQSTLFKEVVYKNLTVRETETIARKVAHDKVRKKTRAPNPELVELEGKLSESLGTRVQIESREKGGKIMIDFFSPEDIKNIIALISSAAQSSTEKYDMLNRFIESQQTQESPVATGGVDVESRDVAPVVEQSTPQEVQPESLGEVSVGQSTAEEPVSPLVDMEERDGVASESSYQQPAEYGQYTESAPVAGVPAYGGVDTQETESGAPTASVEDREDSASDSESNSEDDSLYSISNFTI